MIGRNEYGGQAFTALNIENRFPGGEPCPRRLIRNCPAESFFASTRSKMCWNAKGHSSKPFGYTVLTASSGGKGLELASLHSVDVVILDYFMPAMNGQKVVIEMTRLRPQAPIILLTQGLGVPEQALNLVDALVD